MNKKKLLLSVLTITALVVSCFTTTPVTFATENRLVNLSHENGASKELSLETQAYISNSSINELNQYIDKLAGSTYDSSKNTTENDALTGESNRNLVTIAELKLAWLAAAEIAKRKGYPCAAKLVQNAVLNKDYYENNGMFSKKIKLSSDYKAWLNNSSASSFRFTSGDLFYALHRVESKIVSSSSQGIMVHIHDVFDFAYDNDYDNLFTSLVNNWAWLCQHSYVLHDIDVDIYFYN